MTLYPQESFTAGCNFPTGVFVIIGKGTTTRAGGRKVKTRAKPLFLLLIVISSSSILANDAAVSGIGGTVELMDEHPTVVMESERVEIGVKSDLVDVTTSFVFRNEGPPVQVKMGFPERGWGEARKPEFKSFEAWVDGKPVKVDTTAWEDTGVRWSRWRMKTVSFGFNQRREVANHYTASTGRVTDGSKFVTYILTTGKSWKGPVGKADVVIDISDISDYQTIRRSPEGYVRDGNLIKWHFESFEPESEINLSYAWGYSAFVVNGRDTKPYLGGLYDGPFAPRIEGGVLMVPAGILPQLLGGEVQYDNVNDKLVYRLSGTEVRIDVPGAKANVHGHIVELPRKARILEGRVMVPFAAVARLVSVGVRYDPGTGKTHIDRPAPHGPPGNTDP